MKKETTRELVSDGTKLVCALSDAACSAEKDSQATDLRESTDNPSIAFVLCSYPWKSVLIRGRGSRFLQQFDRIARALRCVFVFEVRGGVTARIVKFVHATHHCLAFVRSVLRL